MVFRIVDNILDLSILALVTHYPHGIIVVEIRYLDVGKLNMFFIMFFFFKKLFSSNKANMIV